MTSEKDSRVGLVKVKCVVCGKVLYEADIRDGTVKKICPKCKTENVYTRDTNGRCDYSD